LDFCIWIIISLAGYGRLALTENYREFARGIATLLGVLKLAFVATADIGFELSTALMFLDSSFAQVTQVLFGPPGSQYVSIQWGVVTAIAGAACAYLMEYHRRRVFVLRVRLFSRVLDGTRATMRQHEFLSDAPVALSIVGRGACSIRPAGTSPR